MLDEIIVQVLAGGITALIISFFFYFVMPKALIKITSGDREKIDSINEGIESLKNLKEKIDYDPDNEDMVERILRYASLAVLSAKQQLDKGDADKAKYNKAKKEYAVSLVEKMLTEYKKKHNLSEVTKTEKEIIDALIESAVSMDKELEV